MSRTARPRPDLPHEEFARNLAIPKPQYRRRPDEQIDTRDLPHRKIHPVVDLDFRRWLHFQPCSVRGLVDSDTGQVHVCWSPEMVGPSQFASDPCHVGKSYSGALKRTDVRGMFSLCRHGHRLHEDAMDAFDRRYGINRHQIASDQFDAYLAEKERKGIRL